MSLRLGLSPSSRDRLDAEIEAELRFHLEGRLQELLDEGIDASEALRQAEEELGELAKIRSDCLKIRAQGLIRQRRRQKMRNLAQDLFYCGRMLRRHPAFALLALLTLALGIGAATALFSVVNSVLLTPLPYRDAQQLLMVRANWVNQGIERAPLSQGDVADLRQASLLEGVAAFWGQSANLLIGEEAEMVQLAQVTRNFFDLLGIDPQGPGFGAADEDVVLLTHGYWQSRFGGQPVIGQAVRLFNKPHVIAGVLPAEAEFRLPNYKGAPTSNTQVWTVLPFDPSRPDRTTAWLRVFARLKPGASLPQVQSELDAISERQRELYPRQAEVGAELVAYPLLDQVVSEVRTPLWTLLGAVCCVFLIVCANLSSLMRVRVAARTREVAVRRALGAGRGRILSQMLTESLFLCAAGGAAGMLVALAGVRLLLLWEPFGLVRLDKAAIDGRVFFFGLGLALLASLLSGLAPAWRASALRPVLHLRQDQGASMQGRAGRWLVSAQVGLSLMLLIGAGLLLRSFLLLNQQNPGFDPGGVLTFSTKMGVGVDFFDQLEATISGLPGVEAVGSVNKLPLSGAQLTGPYATEQSQQEGRSERPEADLRMVTPGYFNALGIRLVKGRLLEAGDRQGVFVVDDKLASQAWPGEDPLGQRLHLALAPGEDEVWGRVVGVVEHVRHDHVGSDSREAIYYPVYWKGLVSSVVVRTSTDPLSLAEPIRQAVKRIDPQVAISSMQTMNKKVSESLAPNRFALILVAVFAAAALFQTVLGIYGVLAQSAASRRHELGVRMALGAGRESVLRLMMGEGLRLFLPGLAAGVIGSLLLTRLAEALLFGVKATDPATYAAVSLVLLAVAMLACYLPARRALNLDPIQALRQD